MNTPSLCFIFRTFVFALLLSSVARGQDDNFEDGNDTGWTRFTPLGAVATASYGVAGGVYNLACSPSTNDQLGPARCAALRQDKIYSTFCIMVDLVNFGPPDTDETSAGIIARIQPNPALGTVKAYTFTYQTKTGDVEINLTTNEDPTNLSGTIPVFLQPGTAYRMIFFGTGPALEGRIYDKSDLSTPLVVATATDATYAQGTAGVFIFSDGNTQCSASFDNYSATNGSLPPPGVATDGTNLTVSWDTGPGLGRTLQESSDLITWATLDGFTYAAGSTFYTEPVGAATPSRFFRLRLGP